MNILSLEMILIIQQAMVLFVSLVFGFTLIGLHPNKIMKLSGLISLTVSIFCFYFGVFTCEYLYAGILILSIPVVKRALKTSYLFTAIAILLAFVSFIIQYLASQIITNHFSYRSNYHMYFNFIVIVMYISLSYIVYWRKLSIFLESAEMYSTTEKKQKRKFESNLIFMICFLSIIIFWLFYMVQHLSLYPFRHQVYMLSFTVVICILFVCIMRKLSFFELERIELLIDKQYQAELLGFMQIIRSQRHDFNFHLQAISGLLENGSYSECNDYVKTMVNDTSEMNDILPLYHPAVGALLHTFREMAAQKGLQLEIGIYYNLEQIPCTVYEINKIIGNLVQNALDEIEQHAPENMSSIQVIILKRSSNNVIKVSNTFSKDIGSYKNMFNPGYSTKQSHEGIGLTTVQRILSKYNGTIHVEFEEDVIHFIAQIPFKY